jgi:hypothetical protein
MTELDHDPIETEPYIEPAPGAEQSMMDKLRARRAALAGEYTVRMPLPGFDGMLLAEYKKLSYDTTRNIVKRATDSKNPRADLYGQMDILINACIGIYANDGTFIAGGYDRDLAAFFELDGDVVTARQVVQAVIQNDLAIPAHHADLMAWMQDSDQQVNEKLQGES